MHAHIVIILCKVNLFVEADNGHLVEALHLAYSCGKPSV